MSSKTQYIDHRNKFISPPTEAPNPYGLPPDPPSCQRLFMSRGETYLQFSNHNNTNKSHYNMYNSNQTNDNPFYDTSNVINGQFLESVRLEKLPHLNSNYKTPVNGKSTAMTTLRYHERYNRRGSTRI